MTTDADSLARACLDLLLSAIGSQRADHYMDAYNTVRAALAGRGISEGWKMVPIEPTEEMMTDGNSYAGWGTLEKRNPYATAQGVYESMINAAPHAPAQQQNSGGSYGVLASPSEGMEPSSNDGSPESRPDAPCETVEGLDEALDRCDDLFHYPYKDSKYRQIIEKAAKLQLKRQRGE